MSESLLLNLEIEFAELATIEAESIGWLIQCEGATCMWVKPDEEAVVMNVVGVPDAGMAGMNVVLVGRG